MTRLDATLYWGLALCYGLAMFVEPFPLHWAVKAAPIWWLAGCVWRRSAASTRGVLLVAVLLGSAGDVYLALDQFIPGLAAFLVGQLVYAFLFSRRRQWRPERLGPAVFLVLWAIAVLAWVWGNLGDLAIPVLGYMVAILLMGQAAMFSRYPFWPGVIGAGTFILSDSLIALGLFVQPLPAHGWWVMLTYYAAQWWLVSALYRGGPE